MTTYSFPPVHTAPEAAPGEVWTCASGDLRLPANIECWPTQAKLESDVRRAVESFGHTIRRGHPVDAAKGHGFLDSQRAGIEAFKGIPSDAPLIVIEAVWQYPHHVLPGLRSHRGPILLIANWSGQFPGLVGMLGLSASLTKAGVAHSTLWSEDFTDEWALSKLQEWLETGAIVHELSHVHQLPPLPDTDEVRLGKALAEQLKSEKAIMGVFDEGCMGMYNAIIDDEFLNPLGIFKERLSQSALVAEMRRTPDEEAAAVRTWLDARGMTFYTGEDEANELTDAQLLQQFKMYISALRIADDFGLDVVGIQYQQGLKDTVPASDLAEGLLNNVDRPPVRTRDGSRELFTRAALPHFNEVDEGVAVDALVTNRVWSAMHLDPATTLHDIRWGAMWDGDFVWVLEISGSVPASHNGGYDKSYSKRQPKMFFPLGGGTLSGVSKPGEVVWSRVFLMDGRLQADLGRATSVELPPEETALRLKSTNEEWPIMHAVLHGVDRNQLMARHKANHLSVAYAPDLEAANKALTAKAAMLDAMGIEVHLCGDVQLAG